MLVMYLEENLAGLATVMNHITLEPTFPLPVIHSEGGLSQGWKLCRGMEEIKKWKHSKYHRGLVKSIMDSCTMIRISYVWIARYREREMDGWIDRSVQFSHSVVSNSL